MTAAQGGKLNIGEMVFHHTADAYSIDLYPLGHIAWQKWPDLHLGGLTVNLTPTKHVVFLFIAAALMYGLTRTPFGRMCNAVRDNPERVQFVGYDPHVIRYLAFCFSGFFAGIAGALAAINFEIANSAYLGAAQSGVVLFATFIGGAGFFIGPILGAIVVTYLQLELSDLTSVWQLYFGLIFIGMVMFAPGGIAGLLMKHRPLLRAGTLGSVIPSYLVALIPTLAMVAGFVLAIEIIVRHTVMANESPIVNLFRVPFDTSKALTWIIAAVLLFGGYLVSRWTWMRMAHAWDRAASIARDKGYMA